VVTRIGKKKKKKGPDSAHKLPQSTSLLSLSLSFSLSLSVCVSDRRVCVIWVQSFRRRGAA
jgi:hypothetical protein